MQFWTHARATEQHHSQETRFEEERGHHLVAHQRSENGSGLIRKHAPVGTELIAHHNARHDPHAKRDCEDFFPIVEKSEIDLFASPEVQTIQYGHVTRQTNREGWKNNMKTDRERKLDPGKRQSI
jgi:hypothetical protein